MPARGAGGRYYRDDISVLERFYDQIEVAENGCWLWTGEIAGFGYGRFTVGFVDGRHLREMAHRFAYQVHTTEPVPEGLHLDHLCRVRRCCNPRHVEPVTPRENILRGTSSSAMHAQQTHCIHGHEFTPENTYVATNQRNPRRQCRACRRAQQRRYQEKVRAEVG